MRTEELRIGNYVKITPEKEEEIIEYPSPYVNEFKVEALRRDEEVEIYNEKENIYSFCLITGVEPIPLTEQWLIDFGFEYDSDSLTYDLGNFIVNNDFENEPTFTIDLYCTGDELILSSVHKLQNLYFALTNEELTLN